MPPKKRSTISGFTLAEVLITLGIIGVVAALTMPALITNYQKQQTINTLKKSYSILQQAIKLSELKNDDTQYWEYTLGAKEFGYGYQDFGEYNRDVITTSQKSFACKEGSYGVWCSALI